jgi:hypothetical protein
MGKSAKASTFSGSEPLLGLFLAELTSLCSGSFDRAPVGVMTVSERVSLSTTGAEAKFD